MRYVLCLALLLASRIAFADGGVESATPPGFSLLDRFDEDSRVGADVSYEVAENSNRNFVRADLHAHFIDDRYHVGGYVQIQRWYTWRPTPIMREKDSGTGAPELGLLYAVRPWTHTSLILRAGATVPTVDAGEYMGAHAQYSRPTDLYQHRPGVGAIRIGASSITHSGHWFGRIDLGIDALYKTPDEREPQAGLRGNIGAGYDLGRAAIMAEASTLTVHVDGHLEMVPSGALSVRGKLGRVQPYACVSMPIFAIAYDWATMLGADVSL